MTARIEEFLAEPTVESAAGMSVDSFFCLNRFPGAAGEAQDQRLPRPMVAKR
jgi:hypothetical protein